jgi:hypothetical protein
MSTQGTVLCVARRPFIASCQRYTANAFLCSGLLPGFTNVKLELFGFVSIVFLNGWA